MKLPKKIDLSTSSSPSVSQLANDIVKTISPESADSSAGGDANTEQVATLSAALVAIANQSWRIANAVVDKDSKEPKEELKAQEIKKMNKALESIDETLGGLGIKLMDRLGEPFDAGLPDQVISEEPREGIFKEHIIRTIRPTIMWHQTMVQRGEIDIAVPTDEK